MDTIYRLFKQYAAAWEKPESQQRTDRLLGLKMDILHELEKPHVWVDLRAALPNLLYWLRTDHGFCTELRKKCA